MIKILLGTNFILKKFSLYMYRSFNEWIILMVLELVKFSSEFSKFKDVFMAALKNKQEFINN